MACSFPADCRSLLEDSNPNSLITLCLLTSIHNGKFHEPRLIAIITLPTYNKGNWKVNIFSLQYSKL